MERQELQETLNKQRNQILYHYGMC